MNIIIIPDSFKGTLSAVRVADIAQEEIKKIIKMPKITSFVIIHV